MTSAPRRWKNGFSRIFGEDFRGRAGEEQGQVLTINYLFRDNTTPDQRMEPLARRLCRHGAASYSYDSRSRRTGLTYRNGASIGYSYDTPSRLSVY